MGELTSAALQRESGSGRIEIEKISGNLVLRKVVVVCCTQASRERHIGIAVRYGATLPVSELIPVAIGEAPAAPGTDLSVKWSYGPN